MRTSMIVDKEIFDKLIKDERNVQNELPSFMKVQNNSKVSSSKSHEGQKPFKMMIVNDN